MQEIIKKFLICSMFLFSFSQYSKAGFLLSKDEAEENNQDTHSPRRQLNLGPSWQHSSYSDYSVKKLSQNFSSLSNRTLRPSLESNASIVDPLVPKVDDDIPVINPNQLNFEEFASQDRNICSINNAGREQKTTASKDGDTVQVQPNFQNPSSSQIPLIHPENSKPKTRGKQNKNCALKDPNNADYTKQISLGQREAIRLPKSPYQDYIPIIETLIQKVIQDKIEIPLKVHVLLDFAERDDFHDAFDHLVSIYTKYPSQFSWSKGNKGSIKREDGTSSCLFELTFVSHAKERERVEKGFAYQISQDNAQKVNWPYVYDVAMRSGFTLDDFKFNNTIKIRLLDCQGNTEEKISEEFHQFLEQQLPKDHNPFHIIGITFNPKIKKEHGCILDGFLKTAGEFSNDWRSRGTVFDAPNGALYLCLNNRNRKLLDLHGKLLPSGQYEGRSVKVAGQETKEFMMQAYETFKDEVTVLTGRGKHVNANKTKGVLKEAFTDWMQDEQLLPLIKTYIPLEGNGAYKAIFVKTCKLNLSNTKTQNILPCIKKTIAQMVAQNKKRLWITLDPGEENSPHNREFHLMMSLYADLQDNSPQFAELLLPISFESKPGEMKIIFNKQHSKCPYSFTFFSGHGNSGVVGTIRKLSD